MPYTTQTETVILRGTAVSFDERPIDGEFVLPEYCPDMAAILKCFVIPTVVDRHQNGDHVTADGHVRLSILYVTEQRSQVCCCEFTLPFTASVALGSNCVVNSMGTRVEYVNCRAAGPRRVEVHGAFRLCITCCETTDIPVVTDICGAAMFTDTCTVPYTAPVGCTEKSFTVNEILEAAPSSEPIRRLIYTRATPLLTEYKQLAGKAILKGELSVFALYCYNEESGALRQLEQSIPFSQILDADCISEDTIDEVCIDLNSADIRSAVDPGGENTLLSVNCKLTACCVCGKTVSLNAVKDAFCRMHPVSLEKRTVNLRYTTRVCRDVFTVRQSLELPTDDITEILSLWCELLKTEGDGNGCLTGRMQLSMLCRNSEGAVSFYERPVDFSVDTGDNNKLSFAYAAIRHTEYTTAGKMLELRVELSCRCCYCEESTYTLIGGATINEETTLPQEPHGVKLYFAEAGESLWDIAKYCRTSRQAIVDENDVAEDVLSESRMLLIPVV